MSKATLPIPNDRESTISEKDEKRPEAQPYTADVMMTPKDAMGNKARLKGDGNNCPVAERSTA